MFESHSVLQVKKFEVSQPRLQRQNRNRQTSRQQLLLLQGLRNRRVSIGSGKMKVGLVRVDGKMPNLALMKLSSWHKKRGDEVFLVDLAGLNLDRVYASQVFVGGPGYDLKSVLPDEIEHMKPDYDLFKTDYSIGFTSRGCVRDCKFCIVREKEGSITNLEGKVQKFNQVLEPLGESQPEWKIMVELAKNLGMNFKYYRHFSHSEFIFQEMSKDISFFRTIK